MKAVILAGGLGTRFSEETGHRPKPMIEIGGKPILWHIMKIYSQHNISDFIICCGYKGYIIKEYFKNYFLHHSDISFDMKSNEMTVLKENAEPWKVTLIDTGENSMTGGRLKRVSDFLCDEDFCFTYGDGLGDIDVTRLVKFHKEHGKEATLTAVYAPGRFGALDLANNRVASFNEKPKGDGAMINGGFFVLSPNVLRRITDDFTVWESDPLINLANEGQLMAYKHDGFWQPMDTLRDKIFLENLWQSDNARWKTWE